MSWAYIVLFCLICAVIMACIKVLLGYLKTGVDIISQCVKHCYLGQGYKH